MNSLMDQIIELGQKRNKTGLQELIHSRTEDELINLVNTKVNDTTFTHMWNYILLGFTDSSDCHKKRLKMVLALLNQLEKSTSIQTTRSTTMVQRLCMELTKFKSEDLLELCSFCLECIQSNDVAHMSWKDLLPELLNVLVEREQFSYNNIEYSGMQYKSEFVSSLCVNPWSPNKVTSLAGLFMDMPMTKDEHFRVVSKLAGFIEKMTPQEIPGFVYHLLRLCRHQNGKAIFLKLQNYFALRIYKNITNGTSDSENSENSNLNAIESTDNMDCIQAESTVLYHIHTAASLGHECVREYLTLLKSVLKTPEFVLTPFNLMTLFTIASVQHNEETVFEIIRPCIVRAYQEEQRKAHSCWFREMVPSTCNVEEVFNQTIKFSLEDRDLVLQPLVNFGFKLLNVGACLGRDLIAERQWQLGSKILLKIIIKKRQITPTVIQTLSNRIITGQNVTHYIECIYLLSTKYPLLMLENQSCIVELMEGMIQIPGNTGHQLLDAVIPLTRVSPTLRDHLILLLRKSLYSKLMPGRQMAVTGFLKLLSSMKISNMTALSQSSSSSFSSGPSLYSQISLNRASQLGPSTFSNEAMCLEVLSIVKRCFMQQAEVRAQLYEGFYDAVCMNPDLGIAILDAIWLHFSQFYIIDEEALPPLDFNKITVVRDAGSILEEPLGKLVYALALITVKNSESDDDNPTVIKFKSILDSLCTRLSKCELINFELDDGTDLLDVLPECQQKQHILKEAISVCEALIGYLICSWTEEIEDRAQEINSLMQVFSRLVHFSKNLAKPKKADAKKRKIPNTTSQQSTNSTIRKEFQPKKTTFKMPESLLDSHCILKTLQLLHTSDFSWISTNQANLLKSKRELHRHFLQATMQEVQRIKNVKTVLDQERSKKIFQWITDCAEIIYNNIIKKLNDFINFDCTSAVLAVEVFHGFIQLVISNYRSNLSRFWAKIGDSDKTEPSVVLLKDFVETYQKLLEMDEEETTDDPEIKKMSVAVLNTLSTLSSQLPSESSALSLQLCDWLKLFSYNHALSKISTTAFVNLLFETHMKYKMSVTLFENLGVCVGDIIGVLSDEEHPKEAFQIANEDTAQNILLSLCTSIKNMLEDIDVVVSRLKPEHSMISYYSEETIQKRKEQLRFKEKGVTCQLCFIAAILIKINNIRIPRGNVCEAVFKNNTLLYSTINALAKYFLGHSSKANPAFQPARFERVVKLTGKQLAPAIYKLILHLDESQKQDPEPKKKCDSSTLKSKMLKETKLFPKVIYEMEQFSKSVTQLTNKTGIDLAKYVGQGTVRDFRILQLKEVLENAGDSTIGSTQCTSGEDEHSDVVNSPPPTKKSKK